MANIDNYLNAIRNATYGREVRSSIVNAIDAINDESEAAKEEIDEFIEGELDTTLTSTTLPAQGKAVGDIVNGLKEGIKDIKFNNMMPLNLQSVTNSGYVYGDVGSTFSTKSTSNWKSRRCSVTGQDIYNFKVRKKGTTVYCVVFIDSSNIVLSKNVIADDDTAEIVEATIESPPGAVYAYLNVYIGDSVSFEPEAYHDVTRIVSSVETNDVWSDADQSFVVTGYPSGNVGQTISFTSGSTWQTGVLSVTPGKAYRVTTVIRRTTNHDCFAFFTDSSDQIISKHLIALTQTNFTQTDYLIAPTNSAKLYLTRYSSTVGYLPVCKEITARSNVQKIRIFEANCGAFEYVDGTTSSEEYKNNWRQVLSDSECDIYAFSDFRSTFAGDIQDTADVVLFGDTIKSFYGGSTTYNLRAANKSGDLTLVGFIDVGGGETVHRKTVAQLHYEIGGYSIEIFVGHFQPSAGYEQARAIQYGNIITEMNKYQRAILIGDFNAQTYSEYLPFSNAGYKIANGGYLPVLITLRTIPADNIVYSPSMRLSSIKKITANLNTDHSPLVCEIII